MDNSTGLLQLPPFQLGFWGTTLLCLFWLVLTTTLTVLNWRLKRRVDEAQSWKEAANAAVTEMEVHKATCERMRGEREEYTREKGEMLTRIGKLEGQTDLKPLVETMSSWVIEGRGRFDEAKKLLDIVHLEQSTALKAVIEEVKAQRTTSEDSYRSITAAFITHTMEDKEYQLRFIQMMDGVERRLTTLAVQMGLPEWQGMQKTVENTRTVTEKRVG